MQTRVQQWLDMDNSMTYDVSVPTVSDFSAEKCGFYGLECEDRLGRKSTSRDWTIVQSCAAGKGPLGSKLKTPPLVAGLGGLNLPLRQLRQYLPWFR
jgi:hypothetical protein